jgi:hypothetical protein
MVALRPHASRSIPSAHSTPTDNNYNRFTQADFPHLVERWFAALTTKQLRRGASRTVAALKDAIREFFDAHDEDPKPVVWTKSADEIDASVARFADRTAIVHAR